MADLMEKIAGENSLPVLNLWRSSGINRRNWKVYGAVPGEDAVHCSDTGYMMIGDAITGALICNFGV